MAAEKEGPSLSERTPLLGGASIVTTAPQPLNTSEDQRFTGLGVGQTLRGELPAGPLTDGFEGSEEPRCWGAEQSLYNVLARVPFIHTVGVLSFFLYFGHVWLLMQRPDIAVAIVLTLMVYGISRFWVMWFSAFHGYALLKKYDSRDPTFWQKQKRPLGSPDFNSIWHAVIIPAYKEPIEKLRQTLDTLAAQSIAGQIVVCMGMEARDPNAVPVAEQLQREYKDKLGGFVFSVHPVVTGEVPGKSSNENWAARCVSKHLVEYLRVNPDCVVITTCDADTFFHPNHFAYVTHAFICDGDKRHHRFYLAITNFLPNCNSVPAVCSTRYTVLTVARLAEMGSALTSPFPLAIYSISLRLAQKAHFWDPTVIPEDWHMYFRCVFADEGKVDVTRLYMAVGTEAVEGKNYMDTIKECYDQSVRWQWGAIDYGYLLVQSASRWDVPFWHRMKLLYQAYDHHLLTVVLVVALIAAPFLYGKIPVMVNLNVWTGSEMLVPLGTLMLYVWIFHFSAHFTGMCYLDHQLRNNVLADRQHFDVTGPTANGPGRWLSLLIFPIADIFLFVVPTIHAHAKLFFTGSAFNYVPSAKMGCKPTACCGGDTGKEKDEESKV